MREGKKDFSLLEKFFEKLFILWSAGTPPLTLNPLNPCLPPISVCEFVSLNLSELLWREIPVRGSKGHIRPAKNMSPGKVLAKLFGYFLPP